MMSSPKKFFPYRDGTLLTALFVEFRKGIPITVKTKTPPLYTVAHDDWEDDVLGLTFISLRKRYLELKDPTEAIFAQTYFFDMRHWDNVAECPAVKPHLKEWRTTLERNIQQEAIGLIITQAEKGSFPAAKWLAEKSWKGHLEGRTSLGRKGSRPTSEDVAPKDDNPEHKEESSRILDFITAHRKEKSK